uniref:Serine protease n=1 Tax=Thermofilum adornatum TaxID=1365176 RepID=A0A7C1GNX6_9CREN
MESPRTLSVLLGKLDRAAEEAEKVLGCEILLLVFHDYASIDRSVVDDLEFFVRRRGRREDLDLCVVLHTSGGDADAAYHIAIRLQDLAGEKRLVAAVPRLAKSAGTIIACAGDVIYATPITELGPVDPQVYIPSTGRYVSARTIRDSLRQAIETLREVGSTNPLTIEKVLSSIPIAEMGDFESLLNHVKKLLKEVISRRMKRTREEEAEAIAETLTRGYEYHGKVIHVDEARRIGLNIEVLSGERLDAMYKLYRSIRDLLDAVDEVLKPLSHELALSPSLHEIEHGLVYLPLPPTETELGSHPASGEASEA